MKFSITVPSVHLYLIDLDASEAQQKFSWSCLSREEKARANRFRFPYLKSRWTLSRAGLRQILASYHSRRPKEVLFEFGQYGKPMLVMPTSAPDIYFNLSHSSSLALIAITRLAPIGVDIERLKPLPDWKKIAHRFFSSEEYQRLMQVPKHQQIESFYRCWTRKEAIIKATGEGLSASLNSFEVSLAPGDAAEIIRYDNQQRPDHWRLHHLDVSAGYIGAVALHSQDVPVMKNFGFWAVSD